MRPPTSRQKTRCKRVLALLREACGPPKRRTRGSAVDSLVATILSQNTNDKNSGAGFANLTAKFADWDAVADARVAAIQRCIRVSGLSRLKAPRIRKLLRAIRDEHGKVDLQFLRRWDAERAYGYLVQFDGVGPKTALCVMMFALGMDVFPVDTHVYRITRRLGLLDGRVPEARAHEVLTAMIPPADRYAMHLLLIAHGRATCLARNPRCTQCRLRKLCPFERGG